MGSAETAVRLSESTFTAVAYYLAGMFSTESAGLLPYILPSLVIGIPLGTWVIRQVRPETFRRICMSFDAWVVGFGVSTLLQQLHVIEGGAAFSVLAGVGTLDLWLLYRFFKYQAPPNQGLHLTRPACRPFMSCSSPTEPGSRAMSLGFDESIYHTRFHTPCRYSFPTALSSKKTCSGLRSEGCSEGKGTSFLGSSSR